MRDDAKLVTGNPPNDYDYRKFADILNRIETFSTAISSTGPIRISELYTTNLATSGTDLKDGQVWNNGGLLVVNPFDAAAARTALGVPADSDLTSVVTGPASSVDGHIPVFNGTTGKVIEDGYSPSYFQQSLADIGSFELGVNLTGDRNSYIDFHSDATNTDFSARILRNPGVNGALAISNNGTGAFTYNSNTIWHSGNFTPANYAPINTPTFTGGFVDVRSAVTTNYGLFQATNSSGTRGFYLGWGNGGTVVNFTGDAATTLSMQGWTTITTGASFTTSGGISATGGISTTGSVSGFIFYDRAGTSPVQWQWYATGGSAYLWSSAGANVLAIDNSSTFSYLGNTIYHAGNYPIAQAATGTTLVQRTSAGYVYATYFNASHGVTTAGSNVSEVYCGVGDGFLRKYTTASVASVLISSLAFGAVGTYALLRINSGTNPGPGGTFAGSTAHFCSADATQAASPIPAGTWMIMGGLAGTGGGTGSTTVCRRIA
jgi:hypothetical protein